MDKKVISIFFCLVISLLFILPSTSAMSISLVTPENGKTYTYSTAIPLDITLTDEGESVLCSYSLDAGLTNVSTTCTDMGLDIPITNSTDETTPKPVRLDYWAENDTVLLKATSNFFVYSNITTAKAIIIIGVIVLVLILAGFFSIYAMRLDNDLAGLKLLFMLLSFITILFSVHLGNLSIREYVRSTPFMNTYDSLYFVVMAFLIVIFAYLFIMTTYKVIISIPKGKR